jgi:hypothetical protein
LAAIGIYRGPSHIFEFCNEELIEIIGVAPCAYLGVPIVETFTGPEWRPLQAVICQTYMTGQPHLVEMPIGDMWVIPLTECGVVTAVATHFVSRVRLPAVRLGEPARYELAV